MQVGRSNGERLEQKGLQDREGLGRKKGWADGVVGNRKGREGAAKKTKATGNQAGRQADRRRKAGRQEHSQVRRRSNGGKRRLESPTLRVP